MEKGETLRGKYKGFFSLWKEDSSDFKHRSTDFSIKREREKQNATLQQLSYHKLKADSSFSLLFKASQHHHFTGVQ